ncbi:MAG: succinate-semialdehyde dehydrogenase [Phycisphaerae bacterium]|nr:succinate-semialdehyde dehydrogenase [Phycisphaerae bacterium]|tara:strand:- start:3780 stop:5150 length:1371 start_codon:yes stop_codon:yes gene_type:complete
MTTFTTINPANGRPIKTWASLSESEVHASIDRVSASGRVWRDTGFPERARLFKVLAESIRERTDELASLITLEMGKPISQSRAECEKCAWLCEYFADNAENFLADQTKDLDGHRAVVSFQPIGTIYAIMPWNFPLWQVFRSVAPTIMAGNSVVLKHAPCVLGCGEAIQSLFHDSGFPEDLLHSLIIDVELSEQVINHDAVRGVTLTGSCQTGRIVAAQAGAALKKSVMELGGSDPYIVLDDADLDLALERILTARMLANGQVCISAKRLILTPRVADQFTDMLLDSMKTYEMEDPSHETCRLGPLAREDLRDHHHALVRDSIANGADCLLGGEVPDRDGWWYPATVLTNVGPGMPAFDDELFGPTAAVIRARDEDDAIRLANQTRFGLGSAVFTSDLEKGTAIARDRIEAGLCSVNDFVKSDPRLPFGGIRESGYGRELGELGIHEFVNIKTLVVS